ncbi:ribonuclease [Altererythrobacter endophyticus]|uniref:Ribonuclease n=2 Tax=Altericroceibacterium endophyticum TaxID=1808508 RepID=A0A6I4T2F5_9SPHN|nr:ribonuclease [Altericroceibacterium endophyticum]
MEWFIENGIGEERAIAVAGGQIVASAVIWPEEFIAGEVVKATLVSRRAGSARGTARTDNAREILVDRLPKDAREGAPLHLQITRAGIAETGRVKLPHSRPANGPAMRPTLLQTLRSRGYQVQQVHRFPVSGWNEVIGEAFSREVTFPGGALQFAPTAAMMLIDIDGTLPPAALAQAAITPLAESVRRFDLGGSIGIDFPTLPAKAERKAVDSALGDALQDWQHERTGMNGFGFVQLVARLERPSLLHRAASQPARLAARLLLRQAEMVESPGALLLTAHPEVIAVIPRAWQDELSRRSGRQVQLKSDPALALEGAFAQSVVI